MAKQLFAGPLLKDDDWGSVARANGNPASGAAVQAYIKGELKKKFGSLYHDEVSNQYVVFADDVDRDAWITDRNTNAALAIARFNAPAPAKIRIVKQSSASEESLLSAKNRQISFNYYIENDAGAASQEGVNVRTYFSLTGASFTRTYQPDRNTWNDPDVGTEVVIPIDEYLTNAGEWEISVTITTATTNVTTTLVFYHTVTKLDLDLSFNPGDAIDLQTPNGKYELDFTVDGGNTSNKMLEVFIDGQLYNDQPFSIGALPRIEDSVKLDLTTPYFTVGKHNLQVRAYIASSNDSSKNFYSDTKYYDFVVNDSKNPINETYILYVRDIVTDPEGEAIDVDTLTTFNATQYNDIDFVFVALNTRNNPVNVKSVFTKNVTGDETPDIQEVNQTVQSGEKFTITRQFQEGGEYDFSVYETTNNTLQFNGKISVSEFSFGGEQVTEQQTNSLIVKYSGLNRTNTASDKDIWVNLAPNKPEGIDTDGILHNVIFRAGQSGWENHSLVLSNGAYLEIPIDLFNRNNTQNGYSSERGLTFEIEFETFNSQSDDAIVMDYSDPNNSSFLKITSTSASMQTNNFAAITTNFKDNSKVKIQFIFHPLKVAENNRLTSDANLLEIFVNGVLDRVTQWGNGISTTSDSITWNNPETQKIIIGNPAGEVGVKIYNLRIYRRALSADEAFMNWVIDQGVDIPAIMNRNNIYKIVGNEKVISLDLVKSQIPTLVLYTDFKKLNNRTYKKDNTMYNMEYFDPIDPSLNFFVRNGWVSLQGTSSMYYPTKNLRPYFNKAAVTGKSSGNSFEYDIMEELSSKDLGTTNNFNTSFNFNTEFFPVTQYSGKKAEEDTEKYLDSNGVLPYSVNSKVTVSDDTNVYHELKQGKTPAHKLAIITNYLNNNENLELYKRTDDGFEIIRETTDNDGNIKSVLAQVTELINDNSPIYISAYRPLLKNGWDIDSAEYWKYLRELKLSGVKIFSREVARTDENGNPVNYKFSNLKKKEIKRGTEYYGLGCYWRQYDGDEEPNHYSGWTDRWTLKADYAESSMTHNGGVGRLWGMAFKNVIVEQEAVCQTKAQKAVAEKGNSMVDIRTSCDGKPIVLFVKNPVGWEIEDGEYTGNFVWGDAEFAGLYNIMTDKSSTALFGFEDIYNEKGEKIFNAKDVECWEYLGNGSEIGQGLTVRYDNGEEITYDKAEPDKNGWNTGKGRHIIQDGLNFEPRWPEDGSAKHEDDKDANGNCIFYQDDIYGVETNHIESFFNWLHFCKPAINYIVDNIDGYTFNPFVKFDSYEEAAAWKKDPKNEGKSIYIGYYSGGNNEYVPEGEKYLTGNQLTVEDEDGNVSMAHEEAVFEFNADDPNSFPSGWTLYWLNENINYDNVVKEISSTKIGDWVDPDTGKRPYANGVWKVKVYSFDSKNRFIVDGNIDTESANKYAVDVYAWREGNTYKYYDNYGVEQTLTANVTAEGTLPETDAFEKDANGRNWSERTFMEYFDGTAEDHLDIYKIAAYYIYIIRFAAVDQALKNQMMTTEDGEHWYFINYDNDTVLGVRNDAILAFNWDVDRDTWDVSGNAFAYAGPKNVLWNNVSLSTKFKSAIDQISKDFYNSRLLDVDTVLRYLDEKMSDTWCERLYNAQEEIKYISTYKKNTSTVRFLSFCQGNRKSHRDWWVTNRWLLYDSTWMTGAYSYNRMGMYMETSQASDRNHLPYAILTASSKYTFRVTRNKEDNVTNIVELNGPGKPNNSAVLEFTSPGTKGDPIQLIGPHKIKVLNLRPGAKLLSGDLSLYVDQVIKGETYNWIMNENPSMTKLLIGNGERDIATTKIMGLDAITTLEEIDVRYLSNLEQDLTLDKLSNLHMYRAAGSNVRTFTTSKGVILNEVSLPVTITTISLTDAIFTTPSTDYIVYQEGWENNDALPYTVDSEGNISGIYTNETAYKYTNDSKAIFEYTPNDILNYVSFDNVTGLDTKRFIMDWAAAINARGKSLSTAQLNLVNIDWTNEKDAMTVSELVKFVKGTDLSGNALGTGKFEFENLTGVISVKSDDPNNDSLTIDEYNKLVDIFKQNTASGYTNIFSDGYNGLRLTTSAGIFYQADGNVKTYTPTGNEPNFAGANYYQLVRGTELTARASIFPDDGSKYVYILTEFNTTDNYQVVYAFDPETNKCITRERNSDNVIAETMNDGSVKINAVEDMIHTSTFMYALTVAKLVDGKVYSLATNSEYITGNSANTNLGDNYAYSKDFNPYVIYLKVVNKIVPKDADIIKYVDDTQTSSLVINDANHVYKLRISLSEATNAQVKTISWSTSNVAALNNNWININDWQYVNENEIEVTVTGKIQETTQSFNLIASLTFDSIVNTSAVNVVFNTKIENNGLKNMKIVSLDANGNEISEVTEFNYTKPGEYNYKVKFDDYNVAIKSRAITNDVPTIGTSLQISSSINSPTAFIRYSQPDENDTFKIIVSDNIENGKFKSEYIEVKLNIVYVDEFNVETTKSYTSSIKLLYPKNMYIHYVLNEKGPNEIKQGEPGVNELTISVLNNQGTTGPVGFTKLNGTNEYVLVEVLSEDEIIQKGSITDTEPVTDYVVTFDNIVIKNADITLTNHGVEATPEGNSLKINIPALSNIIETVEITGKYTVKFDSDYSGAIDAGDVSAYDIVNDFKISVKYSVVDAYNIKDLPYVNNFILVDADGNYYIWPEDESQLANSNIATALANNIEFVGIGKLDNTPNNQHRDSKFMYLIKEEELDLFKCNINQLFNVNASVNIGNGLANFEVSPGDKNTKHIYNKLLDAVGFSDSNLYHIYNEYINGNGKNRDDIDYNYLYIPSYIELTWMFGNDDTVEISDISNIASIINILNSISEIKYFDILSYILIKKFEGSKMYVPTLEPGKENLNNIFALLTSTPIANNGSSNNSNSTYLRVYTFEYNNGKLSFTKYLNNNNNTYYQINGTPQTNYFATQVYLTNMEEDVYRNTNIRFIPFLKVK